MARVGYFSIGDNTGNSGQIDEILAAGHTAVSISINDIKSEGALAGIDILYIWNESNDGFTSYFDGAKAALRDAVNLGLKVVMFDRYVTEAAKVLPGGSGMKIFRDFLDPKDVNIATGAPKNFVNGPGGTLTGSMLDGGNQSSHGYVTLNSLPANATALLTRNNATEVVALSYELGLGKIFYSTIPVDFYSIRSDAAITPTEVNTLVANSFNHVLAGDTLKSTAEILAAEGELVFMAKLAQASYTLGVGEVEWYGINNEKARADVRLNEVAQHLRLLDDRDIPSLAPVNSGNADFPVTGLRNGIYTNGNAAALVARSKDALFLSFRGTNDVDGYQALIPNTSDGRHWVTKGKHYELFEDFLKGVADYLNTTGIKKIYVTGHSLGASMVEAYMDDHTDATTTATTFASPGFGKAAFANDKRIFNLWIEGDPILKASKLADNEGDENIIHHNLNVDSNLHNMSYYYSFSLFLNSEGIDRKSLLKDGLIKGVNVDNIYVHATQSTITNTGSPDYTFLKVGRSSDTIAGSSSDDLILGGAGHDVLNGGEGKDYILGGRAVQDGDKKFVAGDDILYGGSNSDALFGQAGQDTIVGGSGNDYLSGGSGRDVFKFNHESHMGKTAKATDRIDDFYRSEDLIDLSAIEPMYDRNGESSFTFIGTTSFSRIGGELRYERRDAYAVVFGDTDGNGSADFAIRIDGITKLSATDFIL